MSFGLQDAGALVSILVPAVGLCVGFFRLKNKVKESQLKYLPDQWTNEGAVDELVSVPFIHLDLKVEKGEITGELRTHDAEYWVNVTPGWPSAKIFCRRKENYLTFDAIEVSIKLVDNSRLMWRMSGDGVDSIPMKTQLWPVPLAARSE